MPSSDGAGSATAKQRFGLGIPRLFLRMSRGTGRGQTRDRPRDRTRMSALTGQDRTGQDRREEKRREEKKEYPPIPPEGDVREDRQGDLLGDPDAGLSGEILPPEQARPKPEASPARATEAEIEVNFETFWDAYPRKIAKGVARKAFATALKKTTAETILAAVQRQTFDTREKFVPHPASWLNGERWLDQVDTFDPVLRAAGLTPEDFAGGPLSIAGGIQ